MIRVAFPLGSAKWIGGVVYSRNLITALREKGHGVVEPVLLAGSEVDDSLLRDFPPVEVLRTPLMDGGSGARRMRQAVRLATGRDVLLDRFLQSRGVQVLSHAGDLGRHPRTRAIGWIPDFQHCRLPQFFSARERFWRDVVFRNMLRDSSLLLLSSHDAERDLRTYFGKTRAPVRVLQFAVRPSSVVATGLRVLEEKYSFSGPYFHLPNQFWIHKNHRVVVLALQQLVRQGLRPLVLATGGQSDDRHPGYYGELMKLVRTSGVEECFRSLGIVPFADLFGLMRNARAIINPSLFEGWSTTVEEAKALGKRLVLSDLPVHREQAPPGGIYFDPASPGALADVIKDLWQAPTHADPRSPEDATAAAEDRFAHYAEAYERIVLEALQQ